MDSPLHLWIISDLHIGGEYGATSEQRGFRMNTQVPRLASFIQKIAGQKGRHELVINGDFVDFLAEKHPGTGWQPLIADATAAANCFEAIARRDAGIFTALRAVLEAGHRLTILLGNHDVELSFPEVRHKLEEALGWQPGLRFIYDGEAYRVGDVLIEHGNRYDGFNVVHHDNLRRLRSLQSRGQIALARRAAFEAPVGSELVAKVMNPLKERYAFMDLLKPENAAVVPIILALHPHVRDQVWQIIQFAMRARRHDPKAGAEPSQEEDISGRSDDPEPGQEEDMSGGSADPVAESEADIAALPWRRVGGLLRLLRADPSKPLEDRLPALLDALVDVHKDVSYRKDREVDPYKAAAEALAVGGIQYVVFGHTHLPKEVKLENGSRYFNSGSWVDTMRFPVDIIAKERTAALAALREFIEDLEKGRFARWLHFEPTYVRMVLSRDTCVEAGLEIEGRA